MNLVDLGLVLVEISCVVVADSHNPTILNPDWLQVNKVIPENIDNALAQAPITTPPFALVAYSAGLSLSLEQQKLTITAMITEQISDPSSLVSSVAKRYIELLPHIPYLSTGNNFKILVEHKDPVEAIKRKIIQPGPWADETNLSKSYELNFHYTDADCMRNVSISSAEAFKADDSGKKQMKTFLFSSNYHRDCNIGQNSNESAQNNIDKIEEDRLSFQAYVATIVRKIR